MPDRTGHTQLKSLEVHIVHQGTHPDQVPALLTNDLLVAWLNPAGVKCVAQRGLVCVPLIDEHIRLETHVVSLAGNTSQMVSEFVRKFVKLTELRRPPEQLPLPIGSWANRPLARHFQPFDSGIVVRAVRNN
jgi:hypothetical protein